MNVTTTGYVRGPRFLDRETTILPLFDAVSDTFLVVVPILTLTVPTGALTPVALTVTATFGVVVRRILVAAGVPVTVGLTFGTTAVDPVVAELLV